MKEVIEYVAGFLFSPDLYHVVLIEKEKPKWQKGMYNGVGGKIEPGETPEQAMRREFEEEAWLDIKDWHRLAKIAGDGYTVQFFYAMSNQWDEAQSKTTEEVFHIPVDHIGEVRHKVIENLMWLIPLAIDKIKSYSGTITI